jgi:hypothetical protein
MPAPRSPRERACFRVRFVHTSDVDSDIIWNIVTHDLPILSRLSRSTILSQPHLDIPKTLASPCRLPSIPPTWRMMVPVDGQ